MSEIPDEMQRDIEIAARSMRSQSWPGELAEEMEQRADRIEKFLAEYRLHDPHGRFVSGDAERIVELERALHDLCDAFQQVYEAEYGPAPAGENGVYHHARRLLAESVTYAVACDNCGHPESVHRMTGACVALADMESEHTLCACNEFRAAEQPTEAG